MDRIKELVELIAISIFLSPCTDEELCDREFLNNICLGNVQRLIMRLEKEKAIYYKGETMHIYRSWAKKNLKGHDLDFRTEKEKYLDGMTTFAREVYKGNF